MRTHAAVDALGRHRLLWYKHTYLHMLLFNYIYFVCPSYYSIGIYYTYYPFPCFCHMYLMDN
jgi:hypothetical protein